MTTLNKNTKKAIRMIHNYNYYSGKSSSYDIETFYQRPSYNKIKAWRTCKKQCQEKSGYGLCITGGNSSYFSAGFIFENDGKKYLQYITYANNYCIELD